jgi:hypothetical protein
MLWDIFVMIVYKIARKTIWNKKTGPCFPRTKKNLNKINKVWKKTIDYMNHTTEINIILLIKSEKKYRNMKIK